MMLLDDNLHRAKRVYSEKTAPSDFFCKYESAPSKNELLALIDAGENECSDYDIALGVGYYGYRYYNADSGRWLNRDPAEERGGLNLYGMVGNDLFNRTDYLGLLTIQGMIGAPLVVRGTVTVDWEKIEQNGSCCWDISASVEGEVGLGAGVGATLGKAFSLNVGVILAGVGRRQEVQFVVCDDGAGYVRQTIQIINLSKSFDFGGGIGSPKIGAYVGAGVGYDMEVDLNVEMIATIYAMDLSLNTDGFATVTNSTGLTVGDWSIGGPSQTLFDESFSETLAQRTIRFPSF